MSDDLTPVQQDYFKTLEKLTSPKDKKMKRAIESAKNFLRRKNSSYEVEADPLREELAILVESSIEKHAHMARRLYPDVYKQDVADDILRRFEIKERKKDK